MVGLVGAVLGYVETAKAGELSIYEIQHTTDVNGMSPQHGNIVDCIGGIVTHIPPTGRPRLVLQDPNCSNGWGAIQAKDLFSTGAFADVNVGDRVSFTNVLVEDSKGTTFLQYTKANDAGFTISSRDNPLPRPLTVAVDEIAAPIQGTDAWLVADHTAEKYEGMLIRVTNVKVADKEYGKAYDNYVLQSSDDPNLCCWVSDYMNDETVEKYHPYVEIGRHFCGVVGILEQYTAEKDGIYYDYYQLLTTDTTAFVIDQTADFDGDCDVDLVDFGVFARHWLQDGCAEPDWCGGADLTRDDSPGIVEISDLSEYARHWLAGR